MKLWRDLALPIVLLLALAAPATAQMRAETLVSGLTQPVAFVQNPSDPSVQYVVQQGGVIRVVRAGALVATPFLDLTTSIRAGGERGLLGLALPRDYATSGRLYVNFTNAEGHTVVARFRRSATNPLVADASSRFDLRWSTGERIIRQPFSNHNGGNLAFGPDGYLYIGTGDGGSGNDPGHLAQTPSSLLGKMLRIDVNVPDSDPEGLNIPANNPFVGRTGTAPEIWSFGLRNPWRWSFDDPAFGGTGALIIGDVGQGSFEEIDYEPAGRGGRNYGWRNREGAHDNVTTLPPASLPLTDPIFEYGRGSGQSVTGGFVYRGRALGAAARGRYFFADFVAGRVWSLALAVNGTTGEAVASDLREHTAALGGTSNLGLISSFGADSEGELYVVSWSTGRVLRLTATPVFAPLMHIDVPRVGAALRQPFVIAGWAIDAGATTSAGISTIHVWAYPLAGGAPRFVGASYGLPRPDVAAVFGSQFGGSGFGVRVTGLTPGAYRLVAFGLVTATGRFDLVRFVDVSVLSGVFVAIDTPARGATLDRPFVVAGWAADAAARSGTGVDAIHIWAYPALGGPPVFLGAAAYGGVRPDVGAFLGPQFAPSGYGLAVRSLAPGTWDLAVFAHSSVTGAFEPARVVRVVVR